jgi:ArsR family transcriptional regulator
MNEHDTACCTPPDGQAKAHQPKPAQDKELATLCKALGHPARVAIVRHLLATKTCMVGDLVEVLPLAQSTVSQHLKVLKSAGIIAGEVDGPKRCYCVNPKSLVRLQELIEQV